MNKIETSCCLFPLSKLNATKSRNAQPTVEEECTCREGKGEYKRVDFEDDGRGVEEKQLNRLFERFYRVDKSHSREIGGTGLGLAITRTAVLMHRGSIQLQSESGKGTTFIVKIPLTSK